jgi:hypothetical protein
MGAGELICGACGSRWYSAAADQMAAGDATCPACESGPLVLADAANDQRDEADESGP